jgi:hypothetical protein
MAEYVTTFFILSEINYNFATQKAFAEDNGPHTEFMSHINKQKSDLYASHFVQMLSTVESRYGDTVQMWVETQAGGAGGSYFGRHENYCFFGSGPVLRSISQTIPPTPDYPPENWDQHGEYLWWWVPTDALQKSTINVFGVDMTRTSTAPYTFTATEAGTGLYFSKLIFDNDGYMTDFSAKDPSIGLNTDLGTPVVNQITVDGLANYITMGRATPDALVYGNFGTGAGIWKFDGTTWSQVTPNAPTAMVASGSQLYGNFGTGAGIWKFDGTSWSQVTPNSPTAMAVSGALLYGNFGTGGGIWKFDGTTWSQVTPNAPTAMVAEGSLLYGNFGTGAGIWKFDGTSWSQVTPNSPTAMVAEGSLLYGNFGTGAGIWKWNGTNWSQVTPNSPTAMAISGSLLYGNFGTGNGIWKYDGSAWSQVTPNAPTSMVTN